MTKEDPIVQKHEIKETLESKDYILTVYQTGCRVVSDDDSNRQVDPRRFYVVCSLSEIPDYISKMQGSWWTHPDLHNPEVNAEDIPFEEKQWGVYRDIRIEPLNAEFEKSYLEASASKFFKTWRQVKGLEETTEEQVA